MTVREGYDGARVAPHIVPAVGLIRVTKEWGQANLSPLSVTDNELLNKNLVSQSVCPAVYYFKDTPEVRQVLRIPELIKGEDHGKSKH